MSKKCNNEVELGIAQVIKTIRRIPYYCNENRMQISIHRIWDDAANVLVFPSDYSRWFMPDDLEILLSIEKVLAYGVYVEASNNTPIVKISIRHYQ